MAKRRKPTPSPRKKPSTLLNFEPLEQRLNPVAPSILANGLSPVDNSLDFPLDGLLQLEFDRSIKFGTAGTVSIVSLGDAPADDQVVQSISVVTDKGTGEGQVSISGNKLIINPTDTLLASGTQYYVRIDAGAIEAAEQTIINETFDGATLPGLPANWTKVDGFNNPPGITGGNAEWDGWVTADAKTWRASKAPTADGNISNYDRALFTLGQGNIAIADTQLWANVGDPTTLAGAVDASMRTPVISLASAIVGAGQITIDFVSSFRPTVNGAKAVLEVSFDGGTTFEATPLFTRTTQNAPNEKVSLSVDNPGTGDMVLRFRIDDSVLSPNFQVEPRWWAIDNLIVSAKLDPNGSGDGDDFAGIQDRSLWNFATVGLDTTAPTIVSLLPVDNSGGTATEVAVDTNLQITFSEPVVAGFGFIEIRRLSDNAVVQAIDVRSAAVTIAGNVVTINPPADLANSTEYYVQVQAGAFRDQSRIVTTPIYFEDFESLPLLPFITETDLDGDGADWTNVPPSGWTIDNVNVEGNDNRNNTTGTNKGVAGLGIPGVGAPEWQGWAFTDKNEWAVTVGDQGRTQFSRGEGIVAVADPDEWDDIGSPEGVGSYNTLLATPVIPLNKLLNAPVLSFDSSFRNEADTEVFVEATYYDETGAVIGSPEQILYWTWVAGPNFKPDATDESVVLPLNLPSAGKAVSFNFIMRNARNDWWWAIDNVRVEGEYLAGNAFQINDNTTWNFKTFDTSAPVIRALSPADDSGDVPDSAQLTISFDDNVQLGTSGQIGIYRLSDNSLVEAFNVVTSPRLSVTPNAVGGNSVVISPTNPLPLVTNLYVLITPGAIENIAGVDFAGIDKATVWNFATAGLDTTKPTISALSPSDNAFNVSVTAPLVLTFSENILPGDGSILVRNLQTNAIVLGIAATDAKVSVTGNKATVDVTGVLAPGTDYYVEITPGAFRDEAANFFDGISGKSTWNFLTGTAPLTVSSFDPADNSTGALVGTDLTITFNAPAVQVGTGFVTIRRLSDNSLVEQIDVQSGQVTVAGNQAIINPSADLAKITSYYVEATPGSFIGINTKAAASVIYVEDFENLTLFPFQSPGEGGGDGDGTDWTNLTKAQAEGKLTEWTMTTGTTPVGNPVEFFGWTFMDVDSWTATEGNQGRANFLLGGAGKRGTIAVADGDAYDDGTNVDTGLFEAFLSTTVSLENIEANTARVIFDSSWQAEPTQRGKVEVAFDGGTPVTIIDFSSDTTAPDFKPTNFNETLEFALNNPANAKEMKITWSYYQASNDWWWAIDNIRVRANTFESQFGGITGNETWNFFTEGTDDVAPTIVSLTPLDNAVNVPGSKDLVVTFDEPIQFGTAGKITIFRATDNQAVATFDVTSPVGLTPSGNKLTINPPTDLAPLTPYYVQVASGAIQDLAGNPFAGISDQTSWNFSTASVTPIVVSLSPADDSVGAPNITPTLAITFDRIIRRGIGDIIVRRASDGSVVENVEVRSAQVNIVNNTAFINLASTLQELTDYYVEVGSTVFRDEANNNFAGISGSTTWNFTTRENVAPVLVSLAPTDDATNVPVDSDLVITFDENVFAGTGTVKLVSPINDTVIESFNIATSPQINFSGKTLTINPTADLAAGQTFFVILPNGSVVDVYGNKFAGFTNRGAYNFQTAPTDPVIVSLSPSDNNLNVALDANLEVTFSEPISLGAAGTITITDAAGNTFASYDVATAPAELTISGNVLTINPASSFAPTTGYSVTITPGAIVDATSAPFAGLSFGQFWNFYTGVSDTTAPTVTTLTPADDATGVLASSPLVLEMSEAVLKGVGSITVYNSADNSVIATVDVNSPQVSISGSTVTVDLQGALPQDGGSYYVLVTPGAFLDTASATGLTLFAEDFEGFAKYPFPDRGARAGYDGTDWTYDLPTGWARDNSTSPQNASPTYKGFVLMDIDSWVAEAGQNRQDFVLGGVGKRGTVAVADGDQYEDGFGVPGNSLNWFLSTPSISLAGISEDTVQLSFFSSFRPEADQEAIVEVSYDGGLNYSKIFSRKTEDQRNEQVSLTLDTPAGAQSLMVRFGYINADNNWWWAIDNIQVTGNSVGANSFAGITDPTTWNFVSADTTPPTLLSFTPADDSIEVLPSTDLVLNFDDEMAFGTGLINIRRVADGSIFASYTAGTAPELTIVGRTLTINPSTNLESFTDYYIEVEPTALTDTDGNAFAGISDPTTWNFTTLDVEGPILQSQTPLDDAVAIPVSSDITLTFNENILRGSGMIAIYQADGTLVEAFEAATSDRLTISGKTLTIDPTNDLPDATEFYVQIASTAIRDFSSNRGTALTLFQEDFEGLPLMAFQSPTESGGDGTDWTNLSSAQAANKLLGWGLDLTTTDTTGVPEFLGWTFLDADSWFASSGQSRNSFTLGGAGKRGTIAVADGDEYTDNGGGSASQINVFLSTPAIDISSAEPNSTELTFDSSFRPEGTQAGIVEVSFDNGANWQEVFRRDTQDERNEAVSLVLPNPIGAQTVIARFGYINAGNNWWWAIDNIAVSALSPGNAYAGILDTTSFSFSTNDAPVVNDASLSVAENSANGVVVGTVVATDAESTTLSYSILSGNESGAFAINSATGEITVADSSILDFETVSTFNLLVQVEDTGSPVLSDTATITINLTDVNEGPTLADGSFGIAENAANGTLVGTLLGTDPDTSAPFNTLSYVITSGNESGAFALDASTGKLTVADASKLDFESSPQFTLTVEARDGGTPSLVDSATVTINLSDVNEAPTLNDATFGTAENAANGTLVGTLLGTDPDTSAPFNTLSYVITAGNESGAFALDASTGKLTVADASKLDFESSPQFTLTVESRDGGTPSLVDSATVTINLSDVNEAPTLNDATFGTAENAANGTLVGTLLGTDPDTSAPFNTLSYVITSGNESGAFALDASTGKLTVADASKLDFESSPQFTLTVESRDGGTPSLVDSATVTINLTDVNEAPTLGDVTFAINENAGIGAIVGTLAGSDPDQTSPNKLISYVIVSGNESGAFGLNATTGKLTILDASKLDFETTPQFTLQVRVQDAGTPSLSDLATVTVNLNDVNEQPTLQNATFTVQENAPVGTLVGTLMGTDPDTSAPFNTLSYGILTGNDSGAFTLDPANGKLTVADPSKLNVETSKQFNLTVQITDGGTPGLTDTATVTINLGDVNEAPTIDDANFRIDENTPNGTLIGTLFGTDPDANAPDNTLSYVITAGNASGAFALDATTGKLTVADASKLDFETTAEFVLTVEARDGGTPSLADTAKVTISLNDLNEAPTINAATFQVNENAAIGTPVGTVTGSDPDTTAPNNTLSYVILSGNENGAFTLSPAGALSVANSSKLDFETKSQYTLTVQVRDGGFPSLTRTTSVIVNVANVNETPTVPNTTASTNENTPVSIDLLSNATDPDGDVLSIQSVTQPANGTVTITSGRVVLYTPARRFSGTDTFSYVAVDGNGSVVTAQATVTVIDQPDGAGREYGVGSGTGGGTVRFFNADGTERFTITPFGASFTGGIRVASGDFNGDGVNDLVVGTGPGRPTQVRVLDGKTQAELFSVDPFEASFTGGVYIAVGDITGDGVADLAISPDEGGGPRVRIFNGNGFSQVADFFGINDPDFRGGARAAIGDITGDGVADLVVAAGFGGGPRIATFDGSKITAQGGLPGQNSSVWESWKPFGDFLAFEPALRNGTFVAVGDTDGDGKAELIAGGGPGGGPRVSVFAGSGLLAGNENRIADFFAGNTENRGGVRITIKDLDGDNNADLVTGSGTGGGSTVTTYAGLTLLGGNPPSLYEFEAYPGFVGGVFVG